MRLDRYAESLEDLSRANQLLPQSPETLESIAYGLSATGKNQEALAELDLAVDISGPWPYEQQLRNDIVAQLSRNLRDAGASGN
jgi:tetratricopeptide (TPR) repeat protein